MDNVDCLSVIANHCDVQTAIMLAVTSKTNWNAFGFNTNRESHKNMKEDFHLALSRQTTPVMVDLYRCLSTKGNVSPLAIRLLVYLQGRGYNVKKLIEETK